MAEILRNKQEEDVRDDLELIHLLRERIKTNEEKRNFINAAWDAEGLFKLYESRFAAGFNEEEELNSALAEQRRLWSLAAEAEKNQGQFGAAGHYYERAENFEMASENYERGGNLKEAAHSAYLGEDYNRATELYEQLERRGDDFSTIALSQIYRIEHERAAPFIRAGNKAKRDKEYTVAADNFRKAASVYKRNETLRRECELGVEEMEKATG